jgi:hypothetical protein
MVAWLLTQLRFREVAQIRRVRQGATSQVGELLGDVPDDEDP